ncbi:flavodoxin family protein [Halobacillus sp. Marseille-Q1614]|uniref:flavodoxin family protein n=1 Tax=Halobacillus sp. Marseille-Q1614 TaxID=2709134 RepID=UPI00156F5F98|nr:flavodoxin family protein [Halobacillus sp. Marseille-Q1614]
MNILVIHGSTRQNGNTEALAKLSVPENETTHIYLRDSQIQPIQDARHSKEGFQDVSDDFSGIFDQILEHEVLIFATPIYWYSMTCIMKTFIDRFSQSIREEKYKDFKDRMKSKYVYVIAVGGDQPSVKGLPLIQQFEYILQFFGTTLNGYILGEANKPGEIHNDKAALHTASVLKEKMSNY